MTSRATFMLVALAALSGCGARSGLGLPQGSSGSPSDDGGDEAGPITPRSCPPAPSSWTTSIVADLGSTSYAIAADPRCGVDVAWGDAASRLSLSTLDERGAWTREPIEANGHVVAVAATSSAVHVLYRNETGIWWIAKTRGAWGSPELIDPTGLDFGAMRIDTRGVVHVVYEGVLGIGDELRYAVRREGWTTEAIDPRSPFRPTLALAPDGTPHVGYEYLDNSEDHGCTIGKKTSSGWKLVDLPRLDGHTSSSDCTVRIGKDGVFHLAYGGYGAEGHALRHAYGSFESLKFEEVSLLASFGSDTGAADLDSMGALHVAYRGPDGSTKPPLSTAIVRAGSSPTIERLTDTAESGGALVAIDGADVTHVVFFHVGQIAHSMRR